MNEILMTPETGMQFLIWSYYYHNIIPEKSKSFASYGKFPVEAIPQLDEMKNALFRCFEEDSVMNACKQFRMAKMKNEPCPYTQTQLDSIFSKEK